MPYLFVHIAAFCSFLKHAVPLIQYGHQLYDDEIELAGAVKDIITDGAWADNLSTAAISLAIQRPINV